MKRVVVISIVSVFLLTLGASFLVFRSFVQSPASEQKQEIVYEVAPGRSFSSVAKDLEKLGLVRNAAFFSLFARIRGEASKMKVGEYAFQTNMSPGQVMQVLMSGKSIGRNFTIAEGLNIFEIAELIEKSGFGTAAEFLSLVRNPEFTQSLLGEKAESLEGYLFPETYQVTKYTDLKTLVQSMVQRFLSVYAPLVEKAKVLGFTRQQVVTLASVIEKETGAPEERPLISSVFHNRLRKDILLQTDPTVLYAKARKVGTMVEINITRADLKMEDAYNTYYRKGLPPGPIANPGQAALEAALSPAPSEFLFFVSQNNGTHIFSKDYKSHQNAVQQFQINTKARDGKSWRELKTERKGQNLQKPSLGH